VEVVELLVAVVSGAVTDVTASAVAADAVVLASALEGAVGEVSWAVVTVWLVAIASVAVVSWLMANVGITQVRMVVAVVISLYPSMVQTSLITY